MFGKRVVQYDVTDERYPAESLFERVACRVHRAAWVPCWPSWSQPEHVKPWYVLYLCASGGADYVVGGEPYRVDPGDALLLPPHVTRSGRHDPADPFHVYSVHFSARVYGVLDLPALYCLPTLMRPTPERMRQLVALVQCIVTELAGGQTGCLLAAAGDCAELLAFLVRDMAGAEDRPVTAGHRGRGRAIGGSGGTTSRTLGLVSDRRAAELRRLAPVFRLIERSYGQRLTLGQLAQSVHLHPAYFSSVFRAATGMPPLRYVAQYRLDRVRHLLLSTPVPVGEIALETGYRDPSYLDRVFRRVEGCSPSAYRRAKANPIPP